MTKRIDINDPDALKMAAGVISGGGVIVYPTDTLYGLGCDAANPAAVNRINKIKRRSGPVSVIADSVGRVKSWAALDSKEFEKVVPFIGGPQTIILPVRPGVTVPGIQGEGGTLGVRIPAMTFGPELVKMTGRPLTTTSVNRTGEAPLNHPGQIYDLLSDEIDLLVDAGPLPISGGSAIYIYSEGIISRVR